MGVYDRDYMRKQKKPLKPASDAPVKEYAGPKASWWNRMKFKIWLLFKKNK